MKQTLQAMLIALVALMMPIGAWAQTSTIDLSTLTGTYVINDSEEYTFTGTGSHGIKVESGNPTIVLNNANITVGKGSSAIDVASGSNATIFVMGNNTVDTDSEWGRAGGIFVAEGGTVNITSNSNANILRAHGSHASAIGGKYDYDNNESYNAGNINISNVTVYAYTNNFYASAIGAAGEGTCGTINITNAVIYAYGAGDKWTSAPGIGSAMGLMGYSEMIPVVIISDSEVHTFRHNSASDYIGYLGDVEYPSNATGSINCGEGGSVKNSTIYCYTGLDATTTDKVVRYGSLGTLLVEDENGNWVCEGEHIYANGVCENCGYQCTHDDSKHTTTTDNGDGTHDATCTVCGVTVTEAHTYDETGFCTACGHFDTNATEVVITDGALASFSVASDMALETLTYTRTLPNTEWNALYMPFEIEVTEALLADYDVAYANNMHAYDTDDNGEIDELEMEVIKIKQCTLHANHPYFIRARSEAARALTLTVEDAVLYATESTTLTCQSIYTTFSFTGIYSAMDADDFAALDGTHYAIATEGGWWRTEGLGAFRVYMTITEREGSPVKVSPEAMARVRIVARGEENDGPTTEIAPSTLNPSPSTIIYDLAGRRVEQPTKGIYIVNGRKVIF